MPYLVAIMQINQGSFHHLCSLRQVIEIETTEINYLQPLLSTDYYSHSICQTPAFCNPIPWEAPGTPISTSACVPSQKPERQKRPHAQLSHTARQWEVHS